MTNLTKTQQGLLDEFQRGGRINSGRVTIKRRDGSKRKYGIKTLAKLIDNQLINTNLRHLISEDA